MKATEIRGWMNEHELAWLEAHAREAFTIIEVGCAFGRSTRALVNESPVALFAVDTWQGSPAELQTNHRDYKDLEGDFAFVSFYREFFGEIRAGLVIPMRMHFENAAGLLYKEGILADMIFIDGAHDYKAVKRDIANCHPLLREGGLLCGHDYDDSNWPGVRKAVDELLPGATVAPLTRIWIA